MRPRFPIAKLPRRRERRGLLGAAASAAFLGLAFACNALLGNQDAVLSVTDAATDARGDSARTAGDAAREVLEAFDGRSPDSSRRDTGHGTDTSTGPGVDGGDGGPSSCTARGPGRSSCGSGGFGTESCCASLLVTGGEYDRSYDGVTYTDPSFPATISSLRLDKYEITVGRFREFVAATVAGWQPAIASGKHTHLNGGSGLAAAPNVDSGQTYESGWDSSWPSLPTNASDWDTHLACGTAVRTWTPSPSSNENKPITCETWFEAYAFCIWDGGFLPSEAEWNYAASGGGGPSGQRAYPWSMPSTSTNIDCSYANYSHGVGVLCVATGANAVGSESPGGNGAFGHTDLAGNVWEWTLDWYEVPYTLPCSDCADLATATPNRVNRGGSIYDLKGSLLASGRYARAPANRGDNVGARCGRAP